MAPWAGCKLIRFLLVFYRGSLGSLAADTVIRNCDLAF